MLTLYLVCLVLGGVLIAVSIFGGGDADVDVAADADVDLGEVDAETGGEGVVAAARFLSMRNLVFFLAFFGLAGTLLTLLQANSVATVLTSVGLGALAACAVQPRPGPRSGRAANQAGPSPLPSSAAPPSAATSRATPLSCRSSSRKFDLESAGTAVCTRVA